MTVVDLNSDLGEGFGAWRLGDDEALLDIVTSANVACGFHAGDPSIMRRVCGAAVARGVAIGAQVSYRDLAGFGRRRIDMAADELTADILYQLGALQAFAQAAGDRVRYLKPHGALYNTATVDSLQAGAILDAVADFDPSMPVLALPGSVLANLARDRDMSVIAEAFVDRSYRADGTLVGRSEAGSVLHDPISIADRAVALARDGRVLAEDGSVLALTPESLCVHGDNPGAVHIAQAVREGLIDAGVELVPFT